MKMNSLCIKLCDPSDCLGWFFINILAQNPYLASKDENEKKKKENKMNKTKLNKTVLQWQQQQFTLIIVFYHF